ncbi:MAG: ABC transporter ATP-binding protein [Microbacteriaceae bacterium]|nr:ABC transporter ATP-binding protein [Cryobacterium sp.]MCC6377164.1 ABC transporter ATP-binding protein [Microbacteriaceae bacterium]
MVNSVISAKDLRVIRGKHEILHGLNFDVTEGSVVGLLGPSGSGKSTLMRSIVGVQRHVHGEINVLGEPAGSKSLRLKLGYVSQSPSVYEDLTVIQNLKYFASIMRVPRNDATRVLKVTGLESQARQLVSTLSGGQLNRTSLAIALLGKPALLVLDEPTVGLDPVLRADLWTLFRQLAAEGTTLLVSSHVMDEASRCDRLLLLRNGLILADETPAGLLKRTGATDPDDAFLRLIRNEPDFDEQTSDSKRVA